MLRASAGAGRGALLTKLIFVRFGNVLGLDFACPEPTLGRSLALSGGSSSVLRHSWSAPGGLKGALGGIGVSLEARYNVSWDTLWRPLGPGGILEPSCEHF